MQNFLKYYFSSLPAIVRFFFLGILGAWFTVSGLYGQLEEQAVEFTVGGVEWRVETQVLPSGSGVMLAELNNPAVDIAAMFPGENLFPKVFVAPKRDHFVVTWLHYCPGAPRIGFYDSHVRQSVLLPLNNFVFINPLSVVYKDGRPLLLVFSGACPGGANDIYCFRLSGDVPGDIVNLTNTADAEQAAHVVVHNRRFVLETASLHFKRRYMVSFDSRGPVIVREQSATPQPRPARVAALSSAACNTIAGLGDSITWGTIRMNKNKPSDEYHPENAYLSKLQQKFGQSWGKTRIINLGVPSETSFEGAQRLAVELAGVDAGFLLVLYGTNDVTDPGFNPDASIENIEFILTSARDNLGVFPIAATIPPQKRETDIPGIQYFREQTEALNAKIRAMAVAGGFPFIDIYSAFFGYGDWQALLEAYKGNHPSPLGHELIADLFADVILALPPKAPADFTVRQGNGDSQIVSWTPNLEFDFKHYRIRFGYRPDVLDRETTTLSPSFAFILFPFYKGLYDTVYFQVQAEDKDGNGSGYSPVQKVAF